MTHVPLVASGPVDLPTGSVVSIADIPRLLAHVAGVEDHPWGERVSGDVAVAQFDAPLVAGDPRISEGLKLWGLGADTARQLVTSYSCATDGALKLIRRPGIEQVIDLSDDPLEVMPVPAGGPGAPDDRRLRPLRAALDAAAAAERPPARIDPAAHVPAEDVDAIENQMRLLGYL